MSTQYTHLVLVAAPFYARDEANHLACLLGESSSDLHTFAYAGYIDAAGNHYCVAYAATKPAFLVPALKGALPVTPDHAIGIIDRGKAQRAFDSLNKPGGIQMIVDVPLDEALEQLGLTRIATTEES